MLLIAGVTAILAIALVGLGALISRIIEFLLALDLRSKLTFGEFGLLGIALTAMTGMILNWLIPLDAVVGTITVTLGLIAAIAMRTRILETLRYAAPPLLSACILVGLLTHVSVLSYNNNLSNYDTGLYHLPTILLAERSPLILGAANLHLRFGYNSIWLVVVEMLILPMWGLKAAGLINGVITIFGLEAIWNRLWRHLRTELNLPIAIFSAAILLAIFSSVFHSQVSNLGSPSADWPAALMTLYVFILGFRAVVAVDDKPERQTLDLFLMIVMGALATTFQLSQAPILLAIGVAGLRICIENRAAIRGAIVGCSVAAIIILLWMCHGIGLSGCLVYPISMTCINSLPWTIARAPADRDMTWIEAWARLPGVDPSIVLANWSWLPEWWKDVSHRSLTKAIAVAYCMIAVSGIARLLIPGKNLVESDQSARAWWALALQGAAIAGIVYWFLAAPDPRFDYGFLIAQPAMLLALAFPVPRMRFGKLRPLPYILPAATAAAGLSLVLALSEAAQLGRVQLLATDRPTIRTTELAEIHSDSGFAYYRPIGDFRCWASQVFCTPYPDPSLKLNHAGLWSMLTRWRP